jgi:hypothetical protein
MAWCLIKQAEGQLYIYLLWIEASLARSSLSEAELQGYYHGCHSAYSLGLLELHDCYYYARIVMSSLSVNLSAIHVVLLLNALQKELYTTGDNYFIRELADVVSKWLHVLEQCFSTAGPWHHLYRALIL